MSIPEALKYLKILRKRWWVIVLLTASTVGTMLAIASLTEVSYRATTTVQVSAPPPQEDPLYSSFNRQAMLDEIERTQASFVELLVEGDIAYRVVAALSDAPMRGIDLRDRIEIDIPENSQLMKVSVLAPDPEMAASLANAVVETGLERYGQLQAQPTASTREFIERELETTRDELQSAEAALTQFRITNKIGSLDDAIQSQNDLIRSLRMQRDLAQSRGEVIEAHAIEEMILEREAELQSLIGLSPEYNDLVDRVSRVRATHSFLLDKRVEAQIKETQILESGPIQVITPARAPNQPVPAITGRSIALGGIASLLAGVLLSFALEFMASLAASATADGYSGRRKESGGPKTQENGRRPLIENVRVPKPSYLLSRVAPRQISDAALYRVLMDLAERYQLGAIDACHRGAPSGSLNLIVSSSRGQYVFRCHHLTEADVAYEHEVLSYLQQQGFPAPRMLTDQEGRAWAEIEGALYSVYEFVDGYCPSDYLWLPAVQLRVITHCGQMLAEYHRAVADLIPSGFKWSGYRPSKGERWRDGSWFRQALIGIRSLVHKPTATSQMDEWARYRIDAIHRMLGLEALVEGDADLSRLVIHGDYAPWNILFRPGQASFMLDFNEARLDLKIYDLMLATFWFAWRDDHLDSRRAQALQTGYITSGQLSEPDIDMASSVFRWIMARSLTERLYKHYTGQRHYDDPSTMERQYQMCVFAELESEQLVSGLKGAIVQ